MDGWVEVCTTVDIDVEDVMGIDIGGRQLALYHAPDGRIYATDGFCTHEQVRLADGLVMGSIIECPKHNGRFDYRTGEAKGAPVCENLRTYAVRVVDRSVWMDSAQLNERVD